jgi:hypothetical protein
LIWLLINDIPFVRFRSKFVLIAVIFLLSWEFFLKYILFTACSLLWEPYEIYSYFLWEGDFYYIQVGYIYGNPLALKCYYICIPENYYLLGCLPISRRCFGFCFDVVT